MLTEGSSVPPVVLLNQNGDSVDVSTLSGRNVLIYFDRELQDRTIALFASALAWNGFLGVGAKETIRFSKHADQFLEFSGEARIYQKRGGTA